LFQPTLMHYNVNTISLVHVRAFTIMSLDKISLAVLELRSSALQ